MSTDPKDKPLDAAPERTPSLLQRDLQLDRRGPQAVAEDGHPTEPSGIGPRPQPAPARPGSSGPRAPSAAPPGAEAPTRTAPPSPSEFARGQPAPPGRSTASALRGSPLPATNALRRSSVVAPASAPGGRGTASPSAQREPPASTSTRATTPGPMAPYRPERVPLAVSQAVTRPYPIYVPSQPALPAPPGSVVRAEAKSQTAPADAAVEPDPGPTPPSPPSGEFAAPPFLLPRAEEPSAGASGRAYDEGAQPTPLPSAPRPPRDVGGDLEFAPSRLHRSRPNQTTSPAARDRSLTRTPAQTEGLSAAPTPPRAPRPSSPPRLRPPPALPPDHDSRVPTQPVTGRVASTTAPAPTPLAREPKTLAEPIPAGRAAERPAGLPAALRVTEPGAPAPRQPATQQNTVSTAVKLDRVPAGPDPADDADELQDRTLASRPEEQSQDLEAVPAVEVLASPAAQWRHVCAWVVDLTILGGATALLVSAGLLVLGYRPNAPPSFEQLNSVAAPFGGLCALLCFVYSALFGVLWRGRTPGRLAVGLHLVDPRGATPPPWLALVRATLSLVSFGLFLGGFWFALFDRRGQTWHDKLTHTFVVRLRAARP